MGKPVGSWLGERTSRRGFLSKLGAGVVGAGAVLMTAQPAKAACTSCCCTSCLSLGKTCPTKIKTCPNNCRWNGYIWNCCANHRLLRCWDCFCGTSTQCFCSKLYPKQYFC